MLKKEQVDEDQVGRLMDVTQTCTTSLQLASIPHA